MNAARVLRSLFAFCLFLSSAPVRAQDAPEPPPPPGTPARATPRRDGATGLDLGIEGRRVAPRGGSFRWQITAYRVRGLSDLAAAGEVELRVTTSIAPDRPALETRTDALGRTLLVLPVPSDAPPRFQVVLEASTGGLRRRFDIAVRATDATRIELHGDRTSLLPGEPLRVWGRVLRGLHDVPAAGVVIELAALQPGGGPIPLEAFGSRIMPEPVRRERVLGAPLRVRTTARGGFSAVVRLPAEHRGAVAVRARQVDPAPVEDRPPVETSVAAAIEEPSSQPLVVNVAVRQPILASGSELVMDVVVRTAGGRPVEGATVIVPQRPSDARPGRPEPPIRTDARGRAEVRWTPRLPPEQRFAELSVGAQVQHPVYGEGSASADVRLVGRRAFAGLVPEGGAVPEELGGRVFVRVVGPDGAALPGRPAVLRGPRLASEVRGTTDEDGVATLEVRLRAADTARADACGGSAATEVTIDLDGETTETCLVVDQDGALRIRVERPLVAEGSAVRFELLRARSAAGLPVAVALVHLPEGLPPEVVAETVVVASASRGELTLPQGVAGRVLVRARPLFGPARMSTRGGQTALWVAAGGRLGAELALDAAAGSARARFAGDGANELEGVAVTLPLAHARALFEGLGEPAMPASWSEARVAAELARTVGPDTTAAALLRSVGGRIDAVPLPAPRGAEGLGVLRDPWRARARFVEGRLGLILRAIESFVAEAVPMRLDDVAVRSGGGMSFNREILEAIATGGGLGTEGARGLAGEPLSIETLVALDRAITFDNVARRITRERLFYLILALRQLAQSRGLDLPGAGRGDPARWLENLAGQYAPGLPRSISRGDLVDGWGRAFVLRRVTAARYRAIQPIPGYELVSGGPDQRVGTGDDFFDPTVRVLPSGGAYARAVGEDELVARLRGVALQRATLDAAAWMFQAATPAAPSFGERTGAASRSWSDLPDTRYRVRDPEPLQPRRAWIPASGHGGLLLPLDRDTPLPVQLDEEPRAWGTVVHAWNAAGVSTWALAAAAAGSTTLVELELPRFARVGETLHVPAWVTNLAAAPAGIEVRAASSEQLRLEAQAQLTVGPEQATRFDLALTAVASGEVSGDLTLVRDGRAVLRRRVTLTADEGLRPTRQVASALVPAGGETTLRVAIPTDAARAEGRLLLLAPSALAHDALLVRMQRDDPALVAWSHVLGGRAPSDTLRGRLFAAQDGSGWVAGDSPGLATAAAIVVWGAADPDDRDAAAAREAALAALSGGMPQGSRWSEEAQDVAAFREAAATLAVLALSGLPPAEDDEQNEDDMVASYAQGLRAVVRRALRRYRTEPTLAARAAAALLLADPEDGRGLALLDLAAAAVHDDARHFAFVGATAGRRNASERLAATAALALAAHQAGRPELAARLARTVIDRQTAAWRAGGEPAFWTLAAASYGALGGGSGGPVRVSIDGHDAQVRLVDGRAVVPLPADRMTPGRSLEVSVEGVRGAVAARVEVACARRWRAATGSSLRVSIAGDPGAAGGTAALELTVTAAPGRDVRSPIVEVQLPAGTRIDDALRRSVASAGGVLSVRAVTPHHLRIELEPLRRGQERALALPLRWLAHGSFRGLGVVAYAADEPAAMTVVAPRVLAVERPR